MKSRHYVYTLAYPEEMGGAVFYVGKGKGRRIHQHEEEVRRGNIRSPYKTNVIRKIWANGGKVVKTILTYFETHEEAIMYEIALIFFMDNLTNLTNGGDGICGYVFSSETRRKIGDANRGRVHPPISEETRQKLSDYHKIRPRKPFSEEARQKMSKAQKGRLLSEERRHQISESQKGRAGYWKGKALSDEHRTKLSEANKGRPSPLKGKPRRKPRSEEHRRKLSEAHIGKPLSEEHRRKLSESHMGKTRQPHTEETRRKMSEAHKRKKTHGQAI